MCVLQYGKWLDLAAPERSDNSHSLSAGWLEEPHSAKSHPADTEGGGRRNSRLERVSGVGGRELALGSDGLPAGWWWLRGSWAGWEAARQERAGTTRPATRR